MWDHTLTLSIAIFSFLPIIWNPQQDEPNDHIPLPFQFPNLSLIKSDLDHTPQGYCTHWNHWESTFSDLSSIPCPHLAEKKATVDEKVSSTPDYLPIPLGYCSPVTNMCTNSSSVFSSVYCDRIASKHTENYWEFAEHLLRPIQCSCSKLDYQNGSKIICYSKERGQCIQIKKTKIFRLPEVQPQNLQIKEALSYGSFIYAFTIFSLGTAIFLLRSSTFRKRTPVCQDWEKLQEETRRKLEEALQYRKNAEERQRKRREEMAKESERRGHETLLSLIGSITLPLLEETRNFNDWMELPD